MQVSQPNNVKIYNLSAGKSLPEWLSERKRRALQKSDIDVRRRIELIQEFQMPTASTNIKVSADRNYIMATGVYKPRVRCYETSQLSMKFERCLDSEIVKFHILSEDYSKMVFLNCDRYVEFHAQYGRYYRTRIPKFGRDLTYHSSSCDLYLVGASPEIYRLNLEQGRFLNPLQTNAVEINTCALNPVHLLFAAGTNEGHVECWDPRSRCRVGVLDVALSGIDSKTRSSTVPAVTALQYRDGLTMGVGTSTGHVLLYDLRSSKPLLTKDHQYGLPINSLAFHDQLDVVLSTDSKILKIWDRETGKPVTSIEPASAINDLCVFPDSGLLFMATEAPKMLVYYIPSLGPAPRWCSFLDNLTEELEEDQQPTVYDDYKFVTKQDLESLGLSHLMGTNLLRAYMHGFFMDIRLYHKAKAIAEPFAYEEYRKKKIQEKLEEERANRVRLKKLPKVNRNLAEKLLDEERDSKKRGKATVDTSNPIGDERFAALFKNPDFQVNEDSEEFRLLHPVLSKHDKDKQKRRKTQQEKEQLMEQFDEIEELEGRPSEDESSSDDEREWRAKLKTQQKEQKKKKERSEPKFYELKPGENYTNIRKNGSASTANRKRVSLGDRLRSREVSEVVRSAGSSVGEKELTFAIKKSESESRKLREDREHLKERKKARRSVKSILPEKKGPVFWRGKRVR